MSFLPENDLTEEPWLYRVFSPIQLVAGRFGVLETGFLSADDRDRSKKSGRVCSRSGLRLLRQ